MQTINTTAKYISKKEKNQITVLTRNLQFSKELVNFRYIINLKCIMNKNNQTLLYLELLDNLDAVIKATEAIDFYYYHTLEHPSHRNENF